MNGNDNKAGCLGQFLRLLGIGPLPLRGSVRGVYEPDPAPVAVPPPLPEELPYKLRDDFLSRAEFSFYRILQQAAAEVVVCPKVNMVDVLYVTQPNENHPHRMRIDRKHVDFLLCDARTMRPRAVVELDDRSHRRTDRQEKDRLKDRAFKAAGLPLLRFPVQRSYDVEQVRRALDDVLGSTHKASNEQATVVGKTPICPKCGVAMVRRVAGRGAQQGQAFWGCPNYPKCRETMAAE